METIIIRSDNPELLSKIKNFITDLKVNFDVLKLANNKKEKFSSQGEDFINFTEEELKDRIKNSELDYQNKEYLSHEEVIELSKKW